jgi:protein Mpv17
MLAAWGNLRPLPRAALTSGALMAVGDCTCQCIQQRLVRKQQQQLDWGRTAKFAVIGLTLHGPYFFK